MLSSKAQSLSIHTFESTEKDFLFSVYQKLEGKNENEEISATPRL